MRKLETYLGRTIRDVQRKTADDEGLQQQKLQEQNRMNNLVRTHI